MKKFILIMLFPAFAIAGYLDEPGLDSSRKLFDYGGEPTLDSSKKLNNYYGEPTLDSSQKLNPRPLNSYEREPKSKGSDRKYHYNPNHW